MPTSLPHRSSVLPVVLAGFTAFLDLYATQPLLPFLARTFHASAFRASLTITAPTIAVAIAAPFAGRLADRFGTRRMIVGSAFALAATTLLAATAADLTQLIFWRFVQGLLAPGVFTVTIAFIHEEWPAARSGGVTAAYVGGTVTGGFTGRALAGVVASSADWHVAFVILGVLTAVTAAIIWWSLPPEPRTHRTPRRGSPGALWSLLQNRQLAATYAVGFGILCTQIAAFTYVTFHLAAPPYLLSTAALGWLFATFLVGAVITPIAGRWIDRYGRRASFLAAAAMGIVAALLTLAPWLGAILAGLSLLGTSVFITQAATSSQVGATAAQSRGLALGLYSTCYYLGGSFGGAFPSLLLARGGWPACVGFIVAVQLAMLTIAWKFWTAGPAGEPLPLMS